MKMYKLYIRFFIYYGNVISESFYNGEVSEANLLNKNLYKYNLSGDVTETLGGRVYMEKLADYSTKTEYDYAGRPLKEYRADGEYVQYEYDNHGMDAVIGALNRRK